MADALLFVEQVHARRWRLGPTRPRRKGQWRPSSNHWEKDVFFRPASGEKRRTSGRFRRV